MAKSDISHSTPQTITVRGHDLARELMGPVNLGDMAFLELQDRLPTPDESIVFNAMLVSLVEHGITPNTLAARLTYHGAPESLQGAVAAGLLGLGTVFVGTIEGSARMLQEALVGESEESGLGTLAKQIVTGFRDRGELIPGIGHPIHKPVDPRAARLFELAGAHGLAGNHVALMNLIRSENQRQSGRDLPVNVTGAIGALAGEMEIPWQICRGLGIMARSIGIVAHLLEEIRNPMAGEVWRRAEE